MMTSVLSGLPNATERDGWRSAGGWVTVEKGRRIRFWAKLASVNRIEFTAPALAAAA